MEALIAEVSNGVIKLRLTHRPRRRYKSLANAGCAYEPGIGPRATPDFEPKPNGQPLRTPGMFNGREFFAESKTKL
jgi:hypothetical protein